MKIRAFGFRRGCGKDTLCRLIQRELRVRNKGLRVQVVGFADLLKNFCHALYGWMGIKPAQYYEENPEEKDHPIMGLPNGWKTPRDVWVAYGNHGRVLDKSMWMNALLKTQTCDILLIKDLRFQVEIDAVLAHHGHVCRVDRPGTDGADGEGDTVLMNSQDWTHIYNNDGDLHKLHKVAMGIVEELI